MLEKLDCKTAGMAGPAIPSVAGTTTTLPIGPVLMVNDNKKSWCRRAAPCLAFLAAFSTAMALLLIWSQAVELRRENFDRTLSRDYVLDHVSMDNPELVEYIREVQFKPTTHHEPFNITITPEEKLLMPLFKEKHNGLYLEYISRVGQHLSTTSWLEAKYGWHGIMVLTDFRMVFEACRTSRHPLTRVLHACLSTDKDTKEITYHQEAEVRVTKLGESPNSIIFSEEGPPRLRLKCFPLYTVLLAFNHTTIDYLSLDSTDSNDVLVLDTIPWDIIQIGILSIRWSSHHSDAESKNLIDKLSAKRYRYVQMTETGKLIFAYSRVKI